MNMNNTMSTDPSAKSSGNGQPCPCGCASYNGTCCQLDCLSRPRFFCGQLLTDQDLNALLTWTQDKLRLARFRHGWGVVCGIDVRCDPKRPGWVVICPGYAMSCCGEDIILCGDTWLDLRDACKQPVDPCAQPAAQPAGGPGADVPAAVPAVLPTTPPIPPRYVDIVLRYQETQTAPVTPLGQSGCQPAATCQYSRATESGAVAWEPGMPGTDPVTRRAAAWLNDFQRCTGVVQAFIDKFGSRWDGGDGNRPAQDIRDWLLDYLDKNPLRHFCGVHHLIHSLKNDAAVREKDAVWLLFWIVMDCRITFLSGGCAACESDSGVPLARVWLRILKDAQGRPACEIEMIDTTPPYRRAIESDQWPAPLGSVNLGPLVWLRKADAAIRLREMGVGTVQWSRFKLPATLIDLKEGLDPKDTLCLNWDAQANVQTVLAPDGTERVMGFRAPVADDTGEDFAYADRALGDPAFTRQAMIADIDPAMAAVADPPRRQRRNRGPQDQGPLGP